MVLGFLCVLALFIVSEVNNNNKNRPICVFSTLSFRLLLSATSVYLFGCDSKVTCTLSMKKRAASTFQIAEACLPIFCGCFAQVNAVSCNSNSTKNAVRIGGLFPAVIKRNGRVDTGGIARQIAAVLAVEEMNNKTDGIWDTKLLQHKACLSRRWSLSSICARTYHYGCLVVTALEAYRSAKLTVFVRWNSLFVIASETRLLLF